jgi:periplasmic divalent cation tolerance protein
MGAEHLLVLSSCPDAASAQALSTALLSERLAACVNRMPGVKSMYRWQNQVERDDEVLLLIKTRADLYPQLEAMIKDMHPYELPEIIAVPISQGSAEYLAWIDSETAR